MEASVKRIREDLEFYASCNDRKDLPGTTRVAYSPSLRQACDYLIRSMEELGMEVREDSVGNVVGIYAGTDPDAPALMAGSHMDTVVSGGNFDGIAGVAAALEAVRMLKENGIRLKSPVMVTGFIFEENSRFREGLFGSRAMAGQVPDSELEEHIDADGISLGEAMKSWGCDPRTALREARLQPEDLKHYIELHIEQNFVLERTQTQIGVVTCIAGAAHFYGTIYGSADHAGGTPMNMRSDASLAFAELCLATERMAIEAGDDTVGTIAKFEVSPGFPNIIPDHVSFVADVRSSKQSHIVDVMNGIAAKLDEVCRKRGCRCETEQYFDSLPVNVAQEDLEAMDAVCEARGYTHRRIFSGAGHDAISISSLCPISMIFLPCVDGRSHCPEEWTDYEDVARGAAVLCDMLRYYDAV